MAAWKAKIVDIKSTPQGIGIIWFDIYKSNKIFAQKLSVLGAGKSIIYDKIRKVLSDYIEKDKHIQGIKVGDEIKI